MQLVYSYNRIRLPWDFSHLALLVEAAIKVLAVLFVHIGLHLNDKSTMAQNNSPITL